MPATGSRLNEYYMGKFILYRKIWSFGELTWLDETAWGPLLGIVAVEEAKVVAEPLFCVLSQELIN